MGPSAKLELEEELKQLKFKDTVDALDGFSVELLLAVGRTVKNYEVRQIERVVVRGPLSNKKCSVNG
jgi:hypothetical protein